MAWTLMRRLQLALWSLVAIAALGAGWLLLAAPGMAQGEADTLGRGDYALTTTDGQTFTEDSLVGAPSAVFFGFTNCPDVCPTTLWDITTWQDELGAEGERLRVFFVTVDPERDTVETLRGYVSYVPGVVGVTGERKEIDKAIQAFRIYAQRVPLDDDNYTMDHSAMVLLFDAEGRLFEPIGYREDPGRAIEKIRRLLAG